MQPFVHAQASAGKSGRGWEEDLPIHEFMDLAKHACPDLRHRLVLHNSDLGPELVSMAFPDRLDAKEIALSHVRQDLGWLPPLEAWLQRCDPERLPRARRDAEESGEIVRSAAEHFRLVDAGPVQRVWDLLTLPRRFVNRSGHMADAILMNGFGPVVVRAVLGPPRQFLRADGSPVLIDFSWVAEGLILAHVGRIYPLDRVLNSFDGREPTSPI